MIRTMPRPKPEVPTVSVLLRMAPEKLAMLDRLRGSTPRGSYVAELVLHEELRRKMTERADRAVKTAAEIVARNPPTGPIPETILEPIIAIRERPMADKLQARSWDGSPIEATKRGPRQKGGK